MKTKPSETSTIALLDVDLSTLDLPHALEACQARIKASLGGYACFVNVHSLTESTRSEALRNALMHATFSFMDGMPLKWLARIHGQKMQTRTSGPDFMREFIRKTQSETHGFLGGAPGQAKIIAKKFEIKQISYSPPYRAFSPENAKEDWNEFLDLCPDRKAPSCVWVGLGAPKQELWMQTVSPLAPETLFFGVGAAFDFLSGSIERAPEWMRNSGLEWVYRASQEPVRLGKRYLITNTLFLYLVVSRSLGRSRTK